MAEIDVVTESDIARTSKEFYTNLNTNIRVDEIDGDVLRTDWCDQILNTAHYIDNIFGNPKRFLEVEELIVDIEKSKKVDSDSVKHLSKHSNFISDFDEEEDRVQPNKIMNAIKEDTFDLYENRFAYSLVNLIADLIFRFEHFNDDRKSQVNERFFYAGNTHVKEEDIECKITMASIAKYDEKTGLPPRVKSKVDQIKNYLTVWQHSAMYKDLKRRRVPNVTHPIKRTNTILKNPNFQAAVQLWDFLYNYKIGERNNETGESSELISEESANLVNNSMLIYYLIMKRMNTKTPVDRQSFNVPLQEATVGMLNSVASLMMELNKSMKKEDLMGAAGAAYEHVKNLKGADASEISEKIKKTIKEFIDTVNYSYFELDEEGISIDTETQEERKNKENNKASGDEKIDNEDIINLLKSFQEDSKEESSEEENEDS